MDKLRMHTPDFTNENINKLAELFPNCVTESHDDDGNVKKVVDFDQLRQELSTSIIEGPRERYQLNWPGKREALLAANAPIAKTLRPCREESVDFDMTKNLFIEGDNLDALKLLQETYLNKVKMIYIDPPYNTGKDFIYKDNFFANSEEYFERSSQKSEVGEHLVANLEANGRFHSDWLTMMYSRIRLARNLLKEDGAIFISINHKEVSNLKKICDEIFDERNMLCLFSWRTDGNFDNQAKFKYCHEYILAYAKDENEFPHPLVVDPNTPTESKLYLAEVRNTIVKNGPKNPTSKVLLPAGFPCGFEKGIIKARDDVWPHYENTVQVEDWKLVEPAEAYSGWSSKELLIEYINNDCKSINDSKGQATTFEIISSGAIEAVKKRGTPSHVISSLNGLGGPQKAAGEISDIGVVFDDYPKPLALIKYLLKMIQGNNFIVIDFYSGSSTTAHAVMSLNAEDHGTRKFIMVQLPETCDEKSEAFKAGYKTISEIGKDRIRRAGKKIKDELKNKNDEKKKSNEDLFTERESAGNTPGDLDIGFRVLKIDNSNMKDVYYAPDAVNQDDLFDHADNIREERTSEDLLFQVLIDWGVDLSLPIKQETIDGKIVFFVDEDAMAACFETDVSEDMVKELAKRKPLRAVFRDSGFESDSVKINVEQIFTLLSPGTEVKSI